MHIKTITGKNIKGWTGTHELGKVNIITGRTGTGKTARADCLEIALTGGHHELGFKAGKLFSRSSGAEMLCSATLSDGRTITRVYKETKTGASGKADVPDDWAEIPPVLFNADAFFGATAKAQTAMLFGATTAADQERIIAEVSAEVTARAKALLPDLYLGLPELGDCEAGLPSWFEQAIEITKTAEASAKVAAKRFTETISGMSKIGEEAVSARHISAIEDDLKRHRGLLQTATEAKATVAEKRRAAAAQAERIEELRLAIASLEDQIDPGAPEEPRDIRDILSNIKMTQGMIALVQKDEAHNAGAAQVETNRAQILADIAELPVTESVADIEWDLDAAREARMKYPETPRSDLEAKLYHAEQNVGRIGDEIARLTGSLNNGLEKHTAEMAGTCCPTCNQKWAEKADILQRAFDEWAAGSEQQIEEARAKRTEAANRVTQAQAALDAVEGRDEAEKTWKALSEKMRQAVSCAERRETLQARLAALPDGKLRAIETPSAQLEAELAALRAEEEHAGLVAKIGEYKRQMANIPQPDDCEEAEAKARAQVDDAINAIDKLEHEARAARTQAANEQAIAEARDKAAEAVNEAAAYAELTKFIEGQRAEILGKTLGPVLDRINRFAVGCTPGPIEFRQGELGCMKGLSWVAMPGLSGGERAAVISGIQGALSTSGAVRVLITDELGRMDTATKRVFANNVAAALHAGIIDQFIGMDVTTEDWASAKRELVNVIAL